MKTSCDNWTDNECYYVDVVDFFKDDGQPNRMALLAGPFRTHEEAIALVDKARSLATSGTYNQGAIWYQYGTVKMATGHHAGKFNRDLDIVCQPVNTGDERTTT